VTEPAPSGTATPKGSLWLAFRVFDEPTKVFQELAGNPRYLVPLICVVVVAALLAFATPTDVLVDQARDQLQPFVERGQLTEDQAAERIDGAGGTGQRLAMLAGGAIAGPVILLIIAGVLTLIFNAMGSEPVGFKREFALVVHANMVALAGAVLTLLLMVFMDMRQQISLGFLFPADSGFMYRYANQVTLFGAWDVFLLALGNTVLTKAKGIGGALAIIGALWLLVKVPFALLGGLFGG